MEKKVRKYEHKVSRTSEGAFKKVSGETKPIDNIPVEMWALIFSKLEEFQDCFNATQVCKFWQSAMIWLSKISWLFVMVFPQILEYLTKRDILNCRLVCKMWHNGVDYFLVNNAIKCPSSFTFSKKEIAAQAANEVFMLGVHSSKLNSLLRNKDLMFCKFSSNQTIKRFLHKVGVHHPRCPILSRSLEILSRKPSTEDCRSPASNLEEYPSNRLLARIGSHLLCLNIAIGHLSSVEALKQTCDLLRHAPNLKKLEVGGGLEKEYDRDETRRALNEMEVKHQMEQFLDTDFKFSQLQCSLESLHVSSINGRCGREFRESLLKIFSLPNLRSLSLYSTRFPENFHAPNLVELSITVDSCSVLESIQHVGSSPLRKYHVILEKSVCGAHLLQTFCLFSSTLVELIVHLRRSFYTGGESHRQSRQFCASFTDPTICSKFATLQSIHIVGYPPPSTNFLCGVKNTLEYLTFQMSSDGVDPLEDVLEQNAIAINEELDLLQFFKQYKGINNANLYKSNVWKYFPKLKVLTISVNTVTTGKWKVEYRREAFRKVEDIEILDNIF